MSFWTEKWAYEQEPRTSGSNLFETLRLCCKYGTIQGHTNSGPGDVSASRGPAHRQLGRSCGR